MVFLPCNLGRKSQKLGIPFYGSPSILLLIICILLLIICILLLIVYTTDHVFITDHVYTSTDHVYTTPGHVCTSSDHVYTSSNHVYKICIKILILVNLDKIINRHTDRRTRLYIVLLLYRTQSRVTIQILNQGLV